MKNKTRTQVIIFLSALILFHLAVNCLWHSSNKMPQGKGAFEHLNKTANMLRIFEGDLKPHFYSQNHSYVYNIIFLTKKWPPFYYFSGLLFYILLFPLVGMASIYAASSFFFALLIIFSYKTSRQNYNHKIGLFSAFFCSFIPYISYASRQYNLEIASTAFIFISYYCLLKSNKFTNKKFSIIAGLFAGISLLFKYTSLVFILSYLLLTIRQLLQDSKKYDLKIWARNLALFSTITTIISMLYYSNPMVIKSLFKRALHPDFISTQISRVYFYLNGMVFDLLGTIITSIFLVSSVIFLKRKKERNIFIFLIGIPLLVISSVPKSDLQNHLDYLIPVLPIIAMLCSATLLGIRKKIVRLALLTFTITVLVFQFFAVSFIIPEGRPIFAHHGFNDISTFFAFSRPPIKKSPYTDVAEYISKSSAGKNIKIGLISDSSDIFAVIFESHIFFRQDTWKMINFALDKNRFYRHLDTYDYLIYSSDTLQDFLNKDKRLTTIKDRFKLKKAYFFRSTIPFFNFEEKVFLFKNTYDHKID